MADSNEFGHVGEHREFAEFEISSKLVCLFNKFIV